MQLSNYQRNCLYYIIKPRQDNYNQIELSRQLVLNLQFRFRVGTLLE